MRKTMVFVAAILLMGASACNLIKDLMPERPGNGNRPNPGTPPPPPPAECELEGKLVKMCGRGVFGELWIQDRKSGTLLKPVRMDSNIILPAVVLTEGTLVRYQARRIEKTRCERAEGFAVHISCFGIVSLNPTPPPTNKPPRRQMARGRLVKKCADSVIGGDLWIAIERNNGREVLQPLKSSNPLPRIRFQEGDNVKVEFEEVGRPQCDPNMKSAAIVIHEIAKI